MKTKHPFRSILGYENLYDVNDKGDVIALERQGVMPHGSVAIYKRKKLRPSERGGYLRIAMNKNGEKKFFLVHRIVAINFIPNPNNKPQVNHINGIKNDNRVENLEWVSASENILHSFSALKREGVNLGRLGILNPLRKKVTQKYLNGKVKEVFEAIADAERKTGIKSTNISRVRLGKAKTTGGFLWE